MQIFKTSFKISFNYQSVYSIKTIHFCAKSQLMNHLQKIWLWKYSWIIIINEFANNIHLYEDCSKNFESFSAYKPCHRWVNVCLCCICGLHMWWPSLKLHGIRVTHSARNFANCPLTTRTLCQKEPGAARFLRARSPFFMWACLFREATASSPASST